MQTNPPKPAINPPEKPRKNRQKLFGARSGFWGLQTIMLSLLEEALGLFFSWSYLFDLVLLRARSSVGRASDF
jgi:hypothetical protein